MENTRAVERLRELVVAAAPASEVRALLTKLLSEAVMNHHLHSTYTVVRVRRNRPGEQFRDLSELSYPPKSLARQQRASSENLNLFYASSCERRSGAGKAFTDTSYGLKVALFETLPELRGNSPLSRGRYDGRPADFDVRPSIFLNQVPITLSIWEVRRELRVARVCPLAMYDQDGGGLMLAQHIFFGPLMQDPSRFAGIDEFWSLMAREFQKLGRQEDEPDYSLSSNAAEILCTELDFDGVSYPSARAEGLGINFAITPTAVDRDLRCTRVERALVSTKDRQLVIDVVGAAVIQDGSTSFTL